MLRKLEKITIRLIALFTFRTYNPGGGTVLRKMDSDLGDNDFLQLLHKCIKSNDTMQGY